MTPIRVLFVCTHNSARSQLAEALLGRLGGDGFEVHSAGTEATRVNPYAIRVLAEQGIDWTGATSKTDGLPLPTKTSNTIFVFHPCRRSWASRSS